MKLHALVLTAAMFAGAAFAEQASVTLDGQTTSVNYAQPAAGAKRLSMAFQVSANIAFKGVRVPKGAYTVYILTDGAQWQLAVNKATGAKAANYDPKLDLGRVPMSMAKGAAAPAAKVALNKVAALAAKVEVTWNGNVASVPFHLDRGGNDSEW